MVGKSLICISFFGALFSFAAPVVAQISMKDTPIVRMQSLDKATARTQTFEARVGSTIQFGPLYIRVQACRKSDPIDKPESAAFIQVWEVPPETGKSEWVFSGWMFASSPALSAMDHPVYDVWVLDCLEKDKPNQAALDSETDQAAPEEESNIEEDGQVTTKAKIEATNEASVNEGVEQRAIESQPSSSAPTIESIINDLNQAP